MIEGTIAIERVTNDLSHLLTLILTNPSIMYCPLMVPVRVLLCPAANNPIAQIYLALFPNYWEKISPALLRVILYPFPYQKANVDINVALIKNEMKSEIAVSALK